MVDRHEVQIQSMIDGAYAAIGDGQPGATQAAMPLESLDLPQSWHLPGPDMVMPEAVSIIFMLMVLA